jgi:SAM-dependent methyltransferase
MMAEKRTLVPCPVCGKSAFTHLFFKGKDDLVKCRACGLALINPQPADAEIAALYTKDFYRPWGFDSDYSSVAEMKVATFEKMLLAVEKYATRGRLLDIGCATGFFLEAAIKRGWDPFGVELSDYSATIAQEKFGRDKIFKGTLEDAAFKDRSFDAVFMVDLIEHVKNANRLLEEVNRIVKEGGIVAIVTPDFGSLSSKLMGKHWPHVHPTHLYYYCHSTLKKLLQRHGFRIVKVAPPTKVLSVGYVQRHFSTSPVPLITPLIKASTALGLGGRKFTVRTGDIFVIACKDRSGS